MKRCLLCTLALLLFVPSIARSQEMAEAEVLARMTTIAHPTVSGATRTTTPYLEWLRSTPGRVARITSRQPMDHTKAPAIHRVEAPAATIDALEMRNDCLVLWRSDRQRAAPTKAKILEFAPEVEMVDLAGATTGREIADRIKKPIADHAAALFRSPEGKAIRDMAKEEARQQRDQRSQGRGRPSPTADL